MLPPWLLLTMLLRRQQWRGVKLWGCWNRCVSLLAGLGVPYATYLCLLYQLKRPEAPHLVRCPSLHLPSCL